MRRCDTYSATNYCSLCQTNCIDYKYQCHRQGAHECQTKEMNYTVDLKTDVNKMVVAWRKVADTGSYGLVLDVSP